MKPYFNFRNVQLIVLAVLVIVAKYVTDPTAGAVTTEFILYVSTPILVILLTHWLRKLLFPYVDMGDLYNKAKNSEVGASLIFIGMSIIVFALMGLFGPSARAQDVSTYIPTQAYTHIPTLKQELTTYWPEVPKKHISPGLQSTNSAQV